MERESPFLAPLEEVERARPGANWKQIGPEASRRLKPLVDHYMGKAHPFRSCVRDQLKHGLTEDHANRRCAVVKDKGMKGTHWRTGPKAREAALALVEEAEARLDVLEEAMTWNGIRLLVMEQIRIRPDGRPVYESAEANAVAEGIVEDLILIEETPEQHRKRSGKWDNLIGRVKGRKRSLADAYADVKKAGHAGSGKVSEEGLDVGGGWREDLHPRDRVGRFRRKLTKLSPGSTLEIEGVRVERGQSGDFTVHHPPTSPRGKNPDLPNADANLAGPGVAAASLAKAIIGRETNPRLPGAPHPADVADRAARARKGARLPSPAERRRNEAAAVERRKAAAKYDESPNEPVGKVTPPGKGWTPSAPPSPKAPPADFVKTSDGRRVSKDVARREQTDYQKAHGEPSPYLPGIRPYTDADDPLKKRRRGGARPKKPGGEPGALPPGTRGTYYHEMLGKNIEATVVSGPDGRGYVQIELAPGSVPEGGDLRRRVPAMMFSPRREALRADESPFWLAPLTEAKLPKLTGNKARKGDADYGQSSNPDDFEKKHPRAKKGTRTGGKFVRKGESGSEVAAVQRAVGASTSEGGGKTTDAPGAFGFSTFAAVKAFQRKHGLQVDGVVGRQTAAAIAGDRNAKSVRPGELTAGDRKRLRGKSPGRRKRAVRTEHRSSGGVLV